jgi:hypothetical protein
MYLLPLKRQERLRRQGKHSKIRIVFLLTPDPSRLLV